MSGATHQSASSPRTLLARHPWAVLAAVVSVGFFIARVLDGVRSTSLGFDFGVFRSGAELSVNEGWGVAYGAERASEFLAAEYFPHIVDRAPLVRFISPPPFAVFARIFTLGPFDLALGVWYGLGVLALIEATRRLGLPRWAVLVFALSPMMAINTWLGQTGAFVLLWFVVVHRAVVGQRDIATGALIGLMILKPVLAVGYGLLLLVQLPRSWRALGTATGVAGALTLPTMVGGFAPWREFIGAISHRADVESSNGQQSLAVAEALKALHPGASTAVTIASWVFGALIAAALLYVANKRFGEDYEAMSAVAVVATVFGSPHLLVYDLLILAIPLVVTWRRGYVSTHQLGVIAAIFTLAFTIGPTFNRFQFSTFGRALTAEAISVILVIALVGIWRRKRSEQSVKLLPVLTDA